MQIHGASEDRYGLVFFRQQEDQEKALSVSKGKLFFGMLIEVTAWNGPGKCWLLDLLLYSLMHSPNVTLQKALCAAQVTFSYQLY